MDDQRSAHGAWLLPLVSCPTRWSHIAFIDYCLDDNPIKNPIRQVRHFLSDLLSTKCHYGQNQIVSGVYDCEHADGAKWHTNFPGFPRNELTQRGQFIAFRVFKAVSHKDDL